MPSIQPRPVLLLGVGIHPIDRTGSTRNHHCSDSSDNDSEASDTSTCTSSPQCKQPGLPVHPTSKTVIPKPEPQSEPEPASDYAAAAPQGGQELGESEDGTSSEETISGIHSDSKDDSNNDQASAARADSSDLTPPPPSSTESEIKDGSPKIKHSVGFEPFSTLYVFDDDSEGQEDQYDIGKAWYSSQDLKSFRADAFLTVNWMVMKGIDSSTGDAPEQPQESKRQHHRGDSKSDYCYYSNKYGYDRKKEMKSIMEASKIGYEFCERGVECRTPLGRIAKNKRRLDALRVVLLYQQMQRQHRRERRRELRRQKQQQNRSDGDIARPAPCIRHRTPDPEAVRWIEAEIEAEALANVYGSYCEESASEAFARGRADASDAGMPAAISTNDDDDASSGTGQEATLLVHPCSFSCKKLSPSTTSAPNHFTKNKIVNCRSLCDDDEDDDDDDEFMDNLISLSFVDHEDDESDDSSISSEESLSLVHSGPISDSRRSCYSEGALIRGTADDDDSFGSDSSVSLGALFFDQNKQSSQEVEQESVVEVELIEGNDENPHKIYFSSERPSSTNPNDHHRSCKNLKRRNSWAHQERKSVLSCSSLPMEMPSRQNQHSRALESPPTSSSFSSLELGSLFFGAAWW